MTIDRAPARGAPSRRAVAALAVALTLASPAAPAAAPLGAQARFAWPDTAVDLASYTTIEECVAAVGRVTNDEARRRSRARMDTLSWSPDEPRRAVPTPIATTARRCSARWQGATAPVEDFALLMPVLLLAGRDADADTLASRRLALLGPGWDAPAGARREAATLRPERERIAVVDSILGLYLQTPAHPARAESLVVALRRSLARPLGARAAGEVTSMLLRVAGVAHELQDTASLSRLSREALRLIDSLPASELPALEEQLGSAQMLASTRFLAHYAANGRSAAIDSLRLGSDVYLRYLLSLWEQASDGASEPPDLPLGRQAPRLVGVAGDPGDVRPVPGRVNMIVFIDDMCSDLSPDLVRDAISRCDEQAAIVRRLVAAHPALEVTLVDRTRGHVADVVFTDSVAEARERARPPAAHGMPGVLVVGTTPFVRLPAPDNRRHGDGMLAQNFKEYSFRRSLAIIGGTALLVDTDGTILRAEMLTRSWEREWSEMIGILLSRQPGGR